MSVSLLLLNQSSVDILLSDKKHCAGETSASLVLTSHVLQLDRQTDRQTSESCAQGSGSVHESVTKGATGSISA